MRQWLYEQGLGEARAALVDGETILEAAIERDGPALREGAIRPARLTRIAIPARRGFALLESGEEALVEPLGPHLTEGAAFLALVTREAIAEPGAVKRARVRPAPPGAEPGDGPRLRDRLAGAPVHDLHPHAPDLLEQAGWSELLEEATGGAVTFPGGALRLSLTPAMTLIDVDGPLDPAALVVAGATAAARTIRRMGIAGSIGIDLPTTPDRAARHAAAAAIDAHLPQPFERTAVNGFGFLQIVRRRPRAALPELLREDAPLAAALALLRRAERTPGTGPLTLAAHPTVLASIAPAWTDALERRLGAPVRLSAEPARPISAGDAVRSPL